MKQLFTLFLGLVLSVGIAQKKELKQAQKLFKASKISEASASLKTNQALIEGSDDVKIKDQYYLLKGQIARLEEDYQVSYDNLSLVQNGDLAASELRLLTSDIVNAAIKQSEQQEFILSAKNLFLAYTIDKQLNVDYLYYAATNAVNAKEYPLALEYYLMLKEMNYTGIVTKYFVTEVATGEESEVSNAEYTIFLKSKDYTNHREEDTSSKYPEIVKNIALIYNDLGQKEKAISAVKDAREANPGDVGLILTEANIYIELDEKERYQELIVEALEQDPNNAVLYYNLGVVSGDLGDGAKSREFYEKAIELDPSMSNAYLNLVALILKDEAAIVEQMNSLTNSRADNVKYDKLKKKREDIYIECVPILKSLIDLDVTNLDAIKTLKNIYGTIGDNDGFKAMKELEEKAQQ
ncbi:tetratricopeptide repeat protein [Flavobacteriaceae bacterium]|nr:tetratricopeptide repeat protein [Flavobacteriaceae bacterium]